MTRRFALLAPLAGRGAALAQGSTSSQRRGDVEDQLSRTKRVNKAIELLAAGQPIYYTMANGRSALTGREEGIRMAQTWADVIIYDMEHGPIDFRRFHDFMQGLVEGGPTKSGHRTPAVIPQLGGALDETTMRANYWVVGQCLDLGAHGIHLCHARDPGSVRVLMDACRFPMHRRGMDSGLGEGLRGSGGQAIASTMWGISQAEYLKRAEPWPLNPDGELLIGLKIEDKHALANVEKTLKVPGIGFAEWGPGDMAMSLGLSDVRSSNPPQFVQARRRVFAACVANKINFLAAESANMTRDVAAMIKECQDAGVVLVGAGDEAMAAKGRQLTRRTMPW